MMIRPTFKSSLLSIIVLAASLTSFVSSEDFVCSDINKPYGKPCSICNFLNFGQEIQPVKLQIKNKEVEVANICLTTDSDSSNAYCCYNLFRRPYCCGMFGHIVNAFVWLIGVVIILLGVIAVVIRYIMIRRANRRRARW